MARTIDYWYQQIIAGKNANADLAGLNSTSKTADFVLWAFIVAVVMAALDNLFDLHKSEVDATIDTLKPHRLTWYRDLALRFQLGQNPIADSDKYANTGLTAAQILAQKIIAQAAVTKVNGSLRMKVVKQLGGIYTPLNTAEKTAFEVFIADQQDAGVNIIIDSLAPDSLRLQLDVWFNPLVLLPDGSRIDGTATTPVPDAINGYLAKLDFNGEYANTLLMDALKLVDGVVFPVVKLAEAKYGLFPYAQIDERYIPDAGYLYLDPANLNINYRQYVQY